jgi:hypothetical protein
MSETTDLPPLRTLAHRLVALSRRLAEGAHVDAPGAALAMEAASEIMRLRGVVRANGLRHGATHPEVDVVIYPEAPHASEA